MRSAPQAETLRPHPDGMILMTTLVVMLLVTILGVGMLFATRTELSTTTNYRQSMKAFNHADAVVQLAIRATDVLAYGTIEDVRDHLAYNAALSDYKIEVSDSLETLSSDLSSDRLSTRRRYLRLGNMGASEPDIIVRDKQDRVVGTIMISHDFNNDSTPFAGGGVGSSGGISDKGNTGVGGVGLQYYVITVSGKDPAAPGGQSFFLDDAEALELTGPQSFITVLYAVVRSS
jgi:hypothetical protein